MKVFHDIKLRDPDFTYCCDGVHGYVFVFNRERRRAPSPRTLKTYQRNKIIVEKLGGRMVRAESELGRRNPPFSQADVLRLRRMVQREHGRKLEVVEHWNGRGCYSLSIGCRARRAR